MGVRPYEAKASSRHIHTSTLVHTYETYSHTPYTQLPSKHAYVKSAEVPLSISKLIKKKKGKRRDYRSHENQSLMACKPFQTIRHFWGLFQTTVPNYSYYYFFLISFLCGNMHSLTCWIQQFQLCQILITWLSWKPDTAEREGKYPIDVNEQEQNFRDFFSVRKK